MAGSRNAVSGGYFFGRGAFFTRGRAARLMEAVRTGASGGQRTFDRLMTSFCQTSTTLRALP